MKRLISIWISLVVSLTACAQSGAIFSRNGVAIDGYDPVAYFIEGKAVLGKTEFSADWKGVKWLFKSADNRVLFLEKPEAYAPQYGGYCAFGASENHLAPTDPKAWTIVGHQLYLNYNQSVKKQWLPDTARRIPLANAYWKQVQKSN